MVEGGTIPTRQEPDVVYRPEQPGEEPGVREVVSDAFQVIRLPSYEEWMTGTPVYSRVFWDLDCVGLHD
jgi:hypothetical protein